MGDGFLVREEQGVVENRVDTPRLWQGQLRVGRGRREDLKGSVMARGKFGFGVGSMDVGSF